MKKLVATLGAFAALGVTGVATAPSASAHWADHCQYANLSTYGVSVMCPKSTTPGTQFSFLATCSNGVKTSSPMTLQGSWTRITCYPSRFTGGVVYYR